MFFAGVEALKCYECNSKLDPRCGEPFNKYTIALVDCEQQRQNDIPHMSDRDLAFYNRDLDDEGKPVKDGENKDYKPQSMCRKTLQTSNSKLNFP